MISRPAFSSKPTRRQPAFRRDDNAVQEVIGFLLAFGITSLLVVAGLLALQTSRDAATARAQEQEADALAHQVAREVLAVADWATRFALDNASRTVALPDQVAGSPYTLTLESSPDQVRLSPTAIDEDGVAPLYLVSANVAICPSSTAGGTITVAYGDGPGPTTPCLYIS